jgi:large subunit ribosomal protein L29
MRPHDIHALSTIEVQSRLRNVQEEMFNLRFQLSVGQLENHNRLTQLRRDIARLRTELRQRELVGEPAQQ